MGFLVAVGAAGIKMDKLTILLGAFGVGIGFGLQNIFNNLVSGIILAFERPIKEGDIIATLADSIESKHDILPHLHLSLGWISKYISYDQLNWETIGSRNTLALLDPLHVMGALYPAL